MSLLSITADGPCYSQTSQEDCPLFCIAIRTRAPTARQTHVNWLARTIGAKSTSLPLFSDLRIVGHAE